MLHPVSLAYLSGDIVGKPGEARGPGCALAGTPGPTAVGMRGLEGASRITESGLEAWEQIQDSERNGYLHVCSAHAVLQPGISVYF